MAEGTSPEPTGEQKVISLSPIAASPRAKLNRAIMAGLHAALEKDPEVSLWQVFPSVHDHAKAQQKRPRKKQPDYGPTEFCERLVARARTARVIFPLSEETTKFLSGYIDPKSKDQGPLDKSLVFPLSQMLLNCERVWEFPTRGVVLKCSDTLAAKVVTGKRDYTEYTSLQYLSEHASDLPFPQPHGLVMLQNVRVIFMTYFPSITLQAVWPKLTHEEKSLIQSQLNDIFIRLRSLPSEGYPLGGVCGEGVQDHHVDDHASGEVMKSATEFEEFRFSIPPHGNSQFIKFLRSLLPPPSNTVVFTHGDFRPANIIVDVDTQGLHSVTGIIDWETSGFYPSYFESTRALYLFPKETDWWKYLPACIAPATNPECWLVGRLWDQVVKTG